MTGPPGARTVPRMLSMRLSRNRIVRTVAGAGFLFFAIKGLVWLAIGGLAIYSAMPGGNP